MRASLCTFRFSSSKSLGFSAIVGTDLDLDLGLDGGFVSTGNVADEEGDNADPGAGGPPGGKDAGSGGGEREESVGLKGSAFASRTVNWADDATIAGGIVDSVDTV